MLVRRVERSRSPCSLFALHIQHVVSVLKASVVLSSRCAQKPLFDPLNQVLH